MKQHQIKQRFIWSHQGINDTRTNKKHQDENFNQDGEKNHTKIHMPAIIWWHHSSRDHIYE